MCAGPPRPPHGRPPHLHSGWCEPAQAAGAVLDRFPAGWQRYVGGVGPMRGSVRCGVKTDRSRGKPFRSCRVISFDLCRRPACVVDLDVDLVAGSLTS